MDLQFREATLEAQKDGLITATIATESPVLMQDKETGQEYYEVLGHQANEVDLSRLESGTAPFLDRHSQGLDAMLGHVTSAKVQNYQTVSDIQIGSHKRGLEVRDLVDNKVLRSVSVGYKVNNAKIVGKRKGKPLVRATNWTPYEVSAVTLSRDLDAQLQYNRGILPQKSPTKPIKEDIVEKENEAKVEVKEQSLSQRGQILSFAAQVGSAGMSNALPLAQKFIAEEKEPSLEGFYGELVKVQEEKREDELSTICSRSDAGQFSFQNLFRGMLEPNGPYGKCRELEIARASNKERGARAEARSEFSIPGIVLETPHQRSQEIALNERVVSGGALHGTQYMAGEFVSFLRDQSKVLPLCRQIGGLTQDMSFARATAGTNVVFVENEVTTNDTTGTDEPSYEVATLSMKTARASSVFSRALMVQSNPQIENLLRADFSEDWATKLDETIVLSNGGTHGFDGVFGNNLAANRLAASASDDALTWKDIVDLEAAVAEQKLLSPSCVYLAHPRTVAEGKVRLKAATGTSEFLIGSSRITADGMLMASTNGYEVISATWIPRTLNSATSLTGGGGDLLMFGNFQEYLFGEFGTAGMDILLDEVTLASRRQVRIFSFAEVGAAIRRSGAFAYIYDLAV